MNLVWKLKCCACVWKLAVCLGKCLVWRVCELPQPGDLGNAIESRVLWQLSETSVNVDKDGCVAQVWACACSMYKPREREMCDTGVC